MRSFLPTIIFRHRKENLKKCSLRGLEPRKDLLFFSYPLKNIPPLDGYIHLSLSAPPLSIEERDAGLLLLDSTWKYEQGMRKSVPDFVEKRSIPECFVTAYPRKQTACEDPEKGLASVEALFLAHLLMGKDTTGLLENYYWKESFLRINEQALLPYLGNDLYTELEKHEKRHKNEQGLSSK